MFSKRRMTKGTENNTDKIERIKRALEEADAVIIGAGAGLSTSAGFMYSGERFRSFFADFEEKYGFHDMYSGGFYPYDTLEEHWAYWSRYIYVNRYQDAPKPTYDKLLGLVKDKDYFVLTTNVDHCFQKAGFDKKRLFYTQGNYGLFQCSEPCCQETFDNQETVRKMLLDQGFLIGADGRLELPEQKKAKMEIASSLLPVCPKCGKPLTMNLRADDTFVENEGWHRAAERYQLFLRRHRDRKVLFLELGVGYNTPGIIKYTFWQMTAENPNAAYACLNVGEAYAPGEIAARSICVDGDVSEILKRLQGK